MQGNKGFFMIDLLLSFSAWFMAAGILLPAANYVISQTMAARQDQDAIQLVYDRLTAMKLDPESLRSQTEVRYGTEFTFVEGLLSDGQMEVCVEYKDIFSKTKRQCANSE